MNSNESIKNSMRKIIKAGAIDAVDFLDCYVTYVYPIGDQYYGTIDVKTVAHKTEIKTVSLSAISSNDRGDFKIPTLSSEVTVAIVNGVSSYVVEYSHLDSVTIDTNKKVRIGATGYEDQDDETDYDEVEANGLESYLELTPEASVFKLTDDSTEGSEKTNEENKTPSSSVSTIEDNSSSNSTTVTQSSDNVKIEANSASMELTESGSKVIGESSSISNGGLTEEAVLGQKLKAVLSAIITQIGLVTTATSMGPQPLLNKVAVDALQSNLDTIMSSTLKIE